MSLFVEFFKLLSHKIERRTYSKAFETPSGASGNWSSSLESVPVSVDGALVTEEEVYILVNVGAFLEYYLQATGIGSSITFISSCN